MKKIAYLGPQGTFTEQATIAYSAGEQAEYLPCRSVEEAVRRIYDKEASEAVIPAENSIEGSVTATLDLLADGCDLRIQHELVLSIEQHFLALEGTAIQQIKRVYSHPQGIAQCKHFLRGHVVEAVVEYVDSTAEGAAIAAKDPYAAAIGSRRAADRYGLVVLKENIHDHSNNFTRFIVLSENKEIAKNAEKTSLVLSVENRPGCLYEMLGEFAKRGIDLCKIESRPSKKKLGEYIFFVDLIGHSHQPVIAEAITALLQSGTWVKFLGCYDKVYLQHR